jgi:hypothetical protein
VPGERPQDGCLDRAVVERVRVPEHAGGKAGKSGTRVGQGGEHGEGVCQYLPSGWRGHPSRPPLVGKPCLQPGMAGNGGMGRGFGP